jgi:NADPH:quinone reductase-like Zn-dependent oxidoreductase
MKGIICEKLGDPLKVADGLPIPEPGPDQLLVKSLYTAINPVYLDPSVSEVFQGRL